MDDNLLLPNPNPGPSRRSFVRAGAAAAAAAAGTVLAGGRAAAQPGNGAGGNALPNLYPNWNALQFEDIQDNENAHRDAVIAAIQQFGGTPRPKPNFKNLNPPNIVTFATMSRTFENTGTGFGAMAVPVAFSRQVQAFLGSIGLIEARQAGWLNSLFNLVQTADVFGTDQEFEQPLTQQQVLNLASPFVADLNGGPPAAFSATPSRANDIAILNFLLVLEYLESDFYNLNVPRFFPQS